MNKRELAKVPRPEPIPASEKYRKSDKFVTTEDLTVDGEQILVLNVFEQDAKGLGLVPVFRTFLAQEDYITQVLTTQKTKWRTGALHNDWDFYSKEKHFISLEDMERFRRFLKGYKCTSSWKSNPDIWDDCMVYQQIILDKRARIRQESELASIDEAMKVLGDVPEAFFEWAREDAMRDSQYLIYKKIEGKKDNVLCTCSVCGKTFETERRILGAKNNEKGECPECASPVTFKAHGRMPKYIRDIGYATYVERLPEGFCLRYYFMYREFTRNEVAAKKTDDSIHEIAREFVSYTDGGKVKNHGYQWDTYKKLPGLRWCPWRRHGWYGQSSAFDCYRSCLYPNNLPEAWEHTPMKYSGLEILSKNTPGKQALYWDAIMDPEKYRAIEILAKTGLNRMGHWLLGRNGYYGAGHGLNEKGTDLGSVLRLDRYGHPNKTNIKTLRQINASVPQLVLMQNADRLGVVLDKDILLRFYNIFGVNQDLLKPQNRYASLHKICRYIESQHEKDKRRKPEAIGKDWQEYIDWCRALKVDLNDEYHYFPPDFYKEHDRVAGEYKAHLDKVEAENKRKQEALAKKQMEKMKAAIADIFESNDGVDAFSIKGKGLILVVPKTPQEIRDEGEALHHCVGTYVNRVAEGKTNIFFVRKTDAPTVPYFTMEFKDGKVEQCRGKRNCGMPPEVEAFTKVFEQKMQEAMKGKGKKEAMKHAG